MQSIKRNKLRDAIAIALVVGATGFASTSFAQDAAEAKEVKDLDTIVVTGTRIKSQTVTASSPVTEIGADEFKYTGATRVDDLVNQYPQMSPYFDSFANNGATGYPTANLRSLGTLRTLVLVNGRRLQAGANGGGADLSVVPAALIERVDILTGGASAVYGADAVAGVVNFILNDEFEGVSLNAGWSGYQHDNDNKYLQGKMDARNFDYPTGNSGLDGESQSISLVVGSQFADGQGHASAWLTWRQNDALFQGQRDYTSCALNAAGNSCGGSATAPEPNFFLFGATGFGDIAHLNPDGSWAAGQGDVYNYAPINYLQRPETKVNFGSTIKYEINEHAVPYIELMYSNRENEIQVAESGTFFGQYLSLDCADPLLGSACADLGMTGPVGVYVGKRNVEGGPRNFKTTDATYRVVAGIEGAINDNWTYDTSLMYGSTDNTQVGINDFVSSRVTDALLGCPAGSFSGCEFYNVWVPGGVTASAASKLGGVKTNIINTTITMFEAYVQGDTGLGWVDGSNITMVMGYDWLKQTYNSEYDSISQAGDFAGAGGPSLPVSGETTVSELYMEANVPLFGNAGFLNSFDMQLGYRYSDYNLSGPENTYKIAFTSGLFDQDALRLRGGYNRAIRAPSINELFSPQQIALWGGSDGCSGAAPVYTLAQCQNTGVTVGQYGSIPASPASQYNQRIGGNPDLTPEQADTWTFGFAYTPINNLDIAIDYYNVLIKERIGTIGASAILSGCAVNATASLCDKIFRNPTTGDLWLGETGYIANLTSNFGEIETSGIDLNAAYSWDMLGGRWRTSIVGTYLLDWTIAPLKGVDDTATYDCTGLINAQCQNPDWRHIMELRYSNEMYTVNARWRYTAAMDYVNIDGTQGTVDKILQRNGNKQDSVSYFDLSGSLNINDYTSVTLGVNNVLDARLPMVGSTLAENGNFLGGYDAGGRFFFANIGINF
jgi:iron complex outermembrane receptor protein